MIMGLSSIQREPSDFLFPSQWNSEKPLSRGYFHKWFSETARDAGLDVAKQHPHAIRHGLGFTMSAAGMNPQTIAQALGTTPGDGRETGTGKFLSDRAGKLVVRMGLLERAEPNTVTARPRSYRPSKPLMNSLWMRSRRSASFSGVRISVRKAASSPCSPDFGSS